ncbi:MAG: ferredoxin--NADP reductase [Burkholderiaceae bacterium]
MGAFTNETVLSVRHWSEDLFSFTTSRPAGLRFRNGHFLMIGLRIDGKPVLRAYSVASPNHAEHLEFFSIKVPDGKLTSRLQHVQPGDEVLVGAKPTGTLVIDDLSSGRNLYLLGTGTGLAPFMGIVRDPEVYERFEHVVLVHGVRHARDLAYADELTNSLPADEYLGEQVRRQLRYVPACTREAHGLGGRITHLMANGSIAQAAGVAAVDPQRDRAMVCGGPGVLGDMREVLDGMGFSVSPRLGEAGGYVYERAFVEQ